MKVAINGFGRIGRLVFRAFLDNTVQKYKDIEIVAINDLAPLDTSIYLLKYDSVHGILNEEIKISEDKSSFSIGSKNIKYFSERNPEALPWKELDIDLVFECTGVFKTKEKSLIHLNAGAKKVLISCPASDADRTVVVGVNDKTVDKVNDKILSCASCTTNCLAPAVKVLQEKFGIVHGFATTIHSYTADQRLIDTVHCDPRRARAAGLNIIPTTTGATKAIEKIFPELQGKLSAVSMRVPTPNVSLVEFMFDSAKKITVEEINNAFIEYSENQLKGILSYTCENVVSSDLKHSSFSSVADLQLTRVVDNNFGHVVLWYDNEWGFSNRMLDAALKLF